MSQPIAIVVAVEEELRAILKRMSPAVVDSCGRFRFHRGVLGDQQVVIAKSGMGADRAAGLVTRLVREYSPCHLIIAGFCAGLSAGELVIPESVFSDSDPAREIRPNVTLLASARITPLPGVRIQPHKLLTSSRILRTSREKMHAFRDARSFGAIDMETFGAAEAANSAGLAWIAVRAVTDGKLDELPLDFNQFADEHGEVIRARIVLSVLLRPWEVPAMVRLGWRSARAASNLAAFIDSYVCKHNSHEKREHSKNVPSGS